MPSFDIPVHLYMSAPVHSVAPDTRLEDAWARLGELGISCLAVAEGGRLRGVVSRTDLLRVGRREAGARRGAALLALPDRTAAEIMSREVVTVGPDAPVSEAAAHMYRKEYHRVFVVDGEGALAGVVSTRDVMLAIRDARVSAPISEVMSSPLFTVGVDEPVSRATDRLERAGVSGLIVVEDDWPVGLFTQEEAMASRDAPRDTPVEEAMSSALICLPVTTRVHRAAAQAAAMRVRRIIAVERRDMRGILTGIDFAHCAAG